VVEGKGDVLFYAYDLGDNWLHALTVYHVYEEAESTGCTHLLAGAMAGPPEDSKGCDGMGNFHYAKAVEQSVRDGWRMSDKFKEAALSMNWQRINIIHPKEFDLDATRHRLATAFRSRNAPKDGAKKVIRVTREFMDELDRVHKDTKGLPEELKNGDMKMRLALYGIKPLEVYSRKGRQ
jgi:hypothetical protein